MREDDNFLVVGLMVVHNAQTRDEQSARETIHKNRVGFNLMDAEFMSNMAEKVWNCENFTQKEIHHIRRNMLKYSAQIAQIIRQ